MWPSIVSRNAAGCGIGPLRDMCAGIVWQLTEELLRFELRRRVARLRSPSAMAATRTPLDRSPQFLRVE